MSSKARRLSVGKAFTETTSDSRPSNGKRKASGELAQTSALDDIESIYDSDEDESLHCIICLSIIDNRTSTQPCGHDAYCFVCILAWTEQSRRCPLCTQEIELLIHNIRSERDYQGHYLSPLPSKSDSPHEARSQQCIADGARRQLFDRPTHPRFRYADWRQRNRPADMPELDAEDLALEKRRYVYKHGLYVKHVASNRFTRYRDHTPQQVSSMPDLKQRLTKWVRRELRVFDGVDAEFLTGYVVSIASQLELRSDSATRLLAEFLGERDAEHFLHESYSFLRSPYKDIRNYDRAVQYDRPERRVDTILRPSEVGGSGTISSRRRSRPDAGRTEETRQPELRPNIRNASRPQAHDRTDRRKERDIYIPNYSKLKQPSRSLEKSKVDDIQPPQQTERSSDPHLLSVPSNTNEAQAMSSDVDDQISLGDEWTETMLTDSVPTQADSSSRVISIFGRGRREKTPPHAAAKTLPEDSHENGAEDGNSLRSSMLRSRRMSEAKRAILESRLSQAKGAMPTTSAGALRHGVIKADVKQRLMLRLEDEMTRKIRDTRSEKEKREHHEDSLRQSVLAILAQRRRETDEVTSPYAATPAPPTPSLPSVPSPAISATLSDRQTELKARIAREKAESAQTAARLLKEETPTTPGAITDRVAELRARMEKEKKLADLRSRLNAEKAIMK